QPLLYQVATASLATSEIAWPIRYLLRHRPEVTTLFANVNGVDAPGQLVLLDDGGSLPYDTLILATGARHAYFGHDEWEPFAPGLCAALAGKARRRGDAGRGRHRMLGRWRGLWRQAARGAYPDLGRWRARLARGRMAQRTGRPRPTPSGRA